jgi:hypothetical protein
MTSISHELLDEARAIARVRSRHGQDRSLLVHTGDRSRASRPRQLAHLALGVLSWLAFAHLGVWLLVNHAPPDWWFVVGAIVGAGLASTLATLVWVWWRDRSDPWAPS